MSGGEKAQLISYPGKFVLGAGSVPSFVLIGSFPILQPAS